MASLKEVEPLEDTANEEEVSHIISQPRGSDAVAMAGPG